MAKSSTTWEKGKKPPITRPKGSKNKKTIVREALGVKGWSDLQGFVEGVGLERCIQEMNQLHGKDFVEAYNKVSEFVKPKLARAEILAKIETNITWMETKAYEEPKNNVATRTE